MTQVAKKSVSQAKTKARYQAARATAAAKRAEVKAPAAPGPAKIKASPQAPTPRGVAAPPKEEPTSRIRVKIRAYDSRIIDQATKTIVETAERHDAKVVGPVPLPTEKVKITVNRSTFVHKNAREQFELRVHKRLIDIINATPKCLDALMSLQLPAGVDIEVKM